MPPTPWPSGVGAKYTLRAALLITFWQWKHFPGGCVFCFSGPILGLSCTLPWNEVKLLLSMKPQHRYHEHELNYHHDLKNAGSLATAVTSGETSGYDKSAEPIQEFLLDQLTA
ncbi:hypothetical protein PC112_g21163 [Phytophthora cactorum]|nr:hypothetical protein PC112_g21163 [Phytophthora cactorum]